jgi:hypothetical protein
MTLHRYHLLTASLGCLLLAGCAGSLKPSHKYAPPPGAAPTQYKTLETGELRATTGHKGDGMGAEVISSETVGEEKEIEILIPLPPDQVDEVQVVSPSGAPVKLSREAQIIHNYETNNVGIKFKIPDSNNLGFRLQLFDNSDDSWPPFRDQ